MKGVHGFGRPINGLKNNSARRSVPRGSTSGSRRMADAKHIASNSGPAWSVRRPRGDETSERINEKEEPGAYLRRETCLRLRSRTKARLPTPSTIEKKTRETVTKLVDDPGVASHLEPRGGELAMKADGGNVEAYLGRGADRARGVAVTRVGRTPWGA